MSDGDMSASAAVDKGTEKGARRLRFPGNYTRLLLLGIMLAAGFRHIDSEWWHYELPEAETYPLIDDGSITPA